MALLLALARNVPQACDVADDRQAGSAPSSPASSCTRRRSGSSASAASASSSRSARAGFGMHVVAFDPFVSAERYRELGVEKADSPDELYAQADFLTIHLPKTPETEGFLNAEAFAKMRDGVRVLNVARGGLIDDDALIAALDSGKVGGCGDRRLQERADDRAPAVRIPQRRRHAAPRRLDRRGDRPRRLSERRAGGRRPDRRRRLDRRQHPRDRRRGHGHARAVPAARDTARQARDGARRGQLGRADRGGVPRPDRRLRHPAARSRGDRGRAAGPHRGAGEPRERSDHGPAARHRLRGEGGLRGAGLQRADPRDGDRGRRARRRRRAPVSARAGSRTSSRSRAGGSRSSSSRT